MAICNNKKCSIGECDQAEGCAAYIPVVTNADRIRAEIATDEVLAEYLIQYRDDWGDYCTPAGFYDTLEEAKEATVKWLKQAAED